MAKRSRKHNPQYPVYFRFLNSILVLGSSLIIIGGFIAGARLITIVLRSAIFICTLYFCAHIIIKAWHAWQELQNSNGKF